MSTVASRDQFEPLRIGEILVVTRMDTPKYGETLKSQYIKYQPILVKS